MFKFNLGLSPVALNNLFVRNSNIHNYNTRNKNKLRSAIGRHKFTYKNVANCVRFAFSMSSCFMFISNSTRKKKQSMTIYVKYSNLIQHKVKIYIPSSFLINLLFPHCYFIQAI